MTTFYITFGFSHPLGNHFLSINAKDENEAREAVSLVFPNWANIKRTMPTDGRYEIVSKVPAMIPLMDFK